MTPRRANTRERAYFERIAQHSQLLEGDGVPGSLGEMFDRLEAMRRRLGDLALPGVPGDGEGDWAAHVAFLHRKRELLGGGADGRATGRRQRGSRTRRV